MYRPFRFLRGLLILGVVVGFGSGFASLAHHHRWQSCHSEWSHDGWQRDADAVRSQAPAPAPQPVVVPQAAPQIIVVSPQAAPAAAPVIVTMPSGAVPVVVTQPQPVAVPVPAPANAAPNSAPNSASPAAPAK